MTLFVTFSFELAKNNSALSSLNNWRDKGTHTRSNLQTGNSPPIQSGHDIVLVVRTIVNDIIYNGCLSYFRVLGISTRV